MFQGRGISSLRMGHHTALTATDGIRSKESCEARISNLCCKTQLARIGGELRSEPGLQHQGIHINLVWTSLLKSSK